MDTKTLLNGGFGFKYKGLDNHGKPKKEYLNKILAMDEKKLQHETETKIWLSAYASNNPKSDYHWQCDACFEVAEEKFTGLYDKAHKNVDF